MDICMECADRELCNECGGGMGDAGSPIFDYHVGDRVTEMSRYPGKMSRPT